MEEVDQMKRMMALCLLAVIGVLAAEATAQDLLPAPDMPPQSYEVQPTPIAPPPAPQAYPPPQHAYPAPVVQPVAVYQNVRIKDRHRIHPCAVPTIVEVPDPCNRHCTVCIEICAPPCECVRVRRHGLLGP